MRAAVMTEVRKPWTIKNLPDPKPQAGQVLIRIRASGMGGTDLHVHHGVMPVSLPLVLGHEPVGEIVEVGPGVAGLRAGDRVGVSWVPRGGGRCRLCQEQREGYCPEYQSWIQMGGGNSELMLARASGCTLVPASLSDEEAAPIFCAGFTVMSGLRNADPRPGDRVAVLGIGGLGPLPLQDAKAPGPQGIPVTGDPEEKEEARRLGANDVVIATDNLGQALLEAGGADVILGTT